MQAPASEPPLGAAADLRAPFPATLSTSSRGAGSTGCAAATAAPVEAGDPFSMPPSYDPLAEELAAVTRPIPTEQHAARAGWGNAAAAASHSSASTGGSEAPRAEASPGAVVLCLFRQGLKVLASLQQAAGSAQLEPAFRAELAAMAAELQQVACLQPASLQVQPPAATLHTTASDQENVVGPFSAAGSCTNAGAGGQQGPDTKADVAATKADLAAMKAQIVAELHATLRGEVLRELRRQP